MKLREIGIIIGYVIVIFGFFYVLGLAINTKNLVENFESREESVTPDRLAELMEDLNTSLKDDLNIGKNRASYQDALSQIHEHINLNMLQTMANTKGALPEDDEMDRVLKLRQYRDVAGEMEEFLDGVRD
jgi:hypothetical protein